MSLKKTKKAVLPLIVFAVSSFGQAINKNSLPTNHLTGYGLEDSKADGRVKSNFTQALD